MEAVTPIISLQAGKIIFNFEELKAYLQSFLDEYKNAVYTEESKTYAKKDVAHLRAMKKRGCRSGKRSKKGIHGAMGSL